jgi:predicted nucleotidyltransferase
LEEDKGVTTMVNKRREINGIISRYTDKLRTLGIDVFQIILYGSFAKKNPSEYSDIDIAAVSPTFKKMDILSARRF